MSNPSASQSTYLNSAAPLVASDSCRCRSTPRKRTVAVGAARRKSKSDMEGGMPVLASQKIKWMSKYAAKLTPKIYP